MKTLNGGAGIGGRRYGRGFDKNVFNVPSVDRQYILPRKLKICHNHKQLKRDMGKF